jgi:anti-sigma factor RsiW
MDCKAFTLRHAAYIDDTLPGVEMAAMRDHLTECAKCAGRDAEVRRALFLLKNLPPIKVSEGFEGRLRARLAAESMSAPPAAKVSDFGMMKWAVAAALLIVVAGGIRTWPSAAPDRAPARLPAVFASVPDETSGDESAYVASMSTGIPMWPALMLAEEGPLRFAARGQNASWDGASRPQ